jgi:putative pyruvate formate lyase activating enzyme
VSPAHFAAKIAESLRLAKGRGLSVPVVWNSGGYDSLEGLALMNGLVDIYMPDVKYLDAARSLRYSKAADYFAVASKSVPEMFRQAGPAMFDNEGVMRRGLLVRHLVLPVGTGDSIAILDWMAENLDRENIVVSLMSQYVPCHESAKYPEINRRITTLEYERVLEHFGKLGFRYGYCQQKSSAKGDYVPEFNGEGV